MQNLIQQILQTKAFSVKLQIYGLNILILTMSGGNKNVDTYHLNKPRTKNE